jgi:pimeloyl-ACP methyl ester carboxylesterase
MTNTTLRVPDAVLHYELRGEGPLIALVGAPMDARPFTELAELLATDHQVLTADPRGIFRSPLDDPEQDSTPELRADDLYRLLTHIDAGPAVVLGSSGGAVTALALAQSHPEVVHTVIAHEPPLHNLLEDAEQLHKNADEMIAAHLSGDVVGAWKLFLTQANIVLPDGVFEHMFGGEREPQVVADERRWFAHELWFTVHWNADLEALRTGPTRIVVGIGAESTGQLCDRTSTALAAALGIEPTIFPGDHLGFAGQPAAFNTALRAIL